MELSKIRTIDMTVLYGMRDQFSRNWSIHIHWPIHRILESAHIHSKFFETISTEVIEKQASPITSSTIAPCHTYQNFSVCYCKYLTCDNWFSRLPTVSCFHGYTFWLSSFARKKLICWSDLQAMSFCICKEEDILSCLSWSHISYTWQSSTGSCHHTTAAPSSGIPAMMPNEGITVVSHAVHGCH